MPFLPHAHHMSRIPYLVESHDTMRMHKRGWSNSAPIFHDCIFRMISTGEPLKQSLHFHVLSNRSSADPSTCLRSIENQVESWNPRPVICCTSIWHRPPTPIYLRFNPFIPYSPNSIIYLIIAYYLHPQSSEGGVGITSRAILVIYSTFHMLIYWLFS